MNEPSAGAIRAVKALNNLYTVSEHNTAMLRAACIIDRETGLKELAGALHGMMVFYGMDRDRENGACEAAWKSAEAALAKAKGTT